MKSEHLRPAVGCWKEQSEVSIIKTDGTLNFSFLSCDVTCWQASSLRSRDADIVLSGTGDGDRNTSSMWAGVGLGGQKETARKDVKSSSECVRPVGDADR